MRELCIFSHKKALTAGCGECFLWTLRMVSNQKVFVIVAQNGQKQGYDYRNGGQNDAEERKPVHQGLERHDGVNRGEIAEEAEMSHDIAHHADDVSDKNHGQSHGDAFRIASEQRRDQDPDGKIHCADNELAKEDAYHVDNNTGNAQATIKEPNDQAGHGKKDQAVNEIADKGSEGFLD